MAGKNQHHVWQFVQRGFGSKEFGKHHIWVYRKDAVPKKTVTEKYGSEDYFYSLEENNAADENITEFENSIHERLREIRSLPHGASVSPDFMAVLISHLEMRSLFIRDEMSNVSQRIVKSITSVFSSKNRLKVLMAAYLEGNPRQLAEKISELNLSDVDKQLATQFAIFKLPELISENTENLARDTFAPLLSGVAEMVKAAHIKSLSEDFTQVERANLYRSFVFRVVRKNSGPIILPDTGLAFFLPNRVTPLSYKRDRVTDVIVPVNSDAYIHGFKGVQNNRDRKTVLRALASCSYRSFVGIDDSVEFKDLSARIGANAKLISEAELHEIVSFKSLLAGVATPNSQPA